MLDIPPPDPGIEIVVASRGMSKGVAQTDGPQLVARPTVSFGPVRLGSQWKNISSDVADGEAALSVSVSPKLGKVELEFGAAYKLQTGVREPTDDRSLEYSASATRKLYKLSLRLAAIYSPDDLGGTKRSWFVEAVPQFQLSKTTRMVAGIGRRARVNGDDYIAFSAGLAQTVYKGVSVEARWHDTNRSSLGSPYKRRVVVSTRMKF